MRARLRIPRLLVAALQVAALVAACGIVFVGGAYLAMRAAVFGSAVTVPAVAGMAVESAREALATQELTLAVTGERHDRLVPAGQVLSQEPGPGQRLKPGRKVKVLVSRGPEDLRTPDVAGMTVPRVRVVLGQESLRLGTVSFVHAPRQPEEQVVAQDPPAGSPVERGARVDLLVSRGAPSAARVMPDLTGMELTQARRLLEDGGFTLAVTRHERLPAVPAGRVVRQFPLAGYAVHDRDSISLVVSE